MAEKVMVSEQYLQDIADSIRTKLKEEDKYKPSEFSSKIDEMTIAPKIEKGLILKACDEDGYVTDAEIVGMTTIPDYAFSNNNNTLQTTLMTKKLVNLKLPDNLQVIGSNAFKNCPELSLSNLPESVNTIKDWAFQGCTKLAFSKLPDGLKTLGARAFFQCTNITLTELPGDITLLDGSTFYQCTNITLSELPSGITDILDSCFYGCTKLTKLDVLSENLKTITTSAFRNCTNLTQIIFRKTTPPTLYTQVFADTPIASGTGYIYVPDESVEAYKTASNWSALASQIKPISELEVSE